MSFSSERPAGVRGVAMDVASGRFPISLGGCIEIAGGPGMSNVSLFGEFDVAEADDLALALLGLVSIPGHEVYLDLRGVDFLGTCALTALVRAADAAASAGSSLQVTAMSGWCRRLFEIASVRGEFELDGLDFDPDECGDGCPSA